MQTIASSEIIEHTRPLFVHVSYTIFFFIHLLSIFPLNLLFVIWPYHHRAKNKNWIFRFQQSNWEIYNDLSSWDLLLFEDLVSVPVSARTSSISSGLRYLFFLFSLSQPHSGPMLRVCVAVYVTQSTWSVVVDAIFVYFCSWEAEKRYIVWQYTDWVAETLAAIVYKLFIGIISEIHNAQRGSVIPHTHTPHIRKEPANSWFDNCRRIRLKT